MEGGAGEPREKVAAGSEGEVGEEAAGVGEVGIGRVSGSWEAKFAG